jgi:hypothetical protein
MLIKVNGFKTKIGSVLNNKDGKVLISNFIYLSLLQVAGYIFPLITFPYLAKTIGVEKFGEIAFALAILSYFQTIVDYGFNFTATRDIAQNRDNIMIVSQIFSNVLWARCILLLVMLLPFVIIVFSIEKLFLMRELLFATFLLLPGHILFPQWLFQGLEKMKYITILNVISKLIFTIAVFLVIREESDYMYQPILTSLGFIVSGIISFYIIVVKWRIKILSPNYKQIRDTIKKSTDVFINQLFPNLYNSFSILLLGLFGGQYANGIFDAGSKLANVVIQFFNVISRVFFPFFSRDRCQHKIYAKYCMLLAGVVSLVLFIIAPWLIRIFFSEEFMSSVPVLRIVVFSMFFLVMSDVFGTNYLIVSGHDKIIRNITIGVSLIGFIIAVPLVYFYSYIGAAMTVTVVRFLLGVFSYIYSLKVR